MAETRQRSGLAHRIRTEVADPRGQFAASIVGKLAVGSVAIVGIGRAPLGVSEVISNTTKVRGRPRGNDSKVRGRPRGNDFTSNLVFSQWDQIFKDPMTTMAAVDRLVHHATILEFTGDTQRTPKKRQD